MAYALNAGMFRDKYSNVFRANERWNAIAIPEGEITSGITNPLTSKNRHSSQILVLFLDDIADIRDAKALALWAIPLQRTISLLPVTSKQTALQVNT